MRMLVVESDIEGRGLRLTDADLLATLDTGRVMARRTDGTIEYWSRGCERLYGYRAEEAIGRCACTLLETIFPVPLEEIEASLLTWGEWHGDLRQTTKDGREVIVAAYTLVRAFDASTTIIETLTDVTAHRLAEAELRRSRALLSSITETTSNLIYAKDREGRTLLANAALLQLLGLTWQEVEGRTTRQLLRDKAQAETIMETDRSIMDAGRMEEVEEVVRGADRRTRVLLSAKAPMRNDDGDVIGLVGVSVDITERKRNEERLGLLVNELNHRVKNTLATGQSIAFHTFQRSDHARFDAFTGRLQALTAVHDVLARGELAGRRRAEGRRMRARPIRRDQIRPVSNRRTGAGRQAESGNRPLARAARAADQRARLWRPVGGDGLCRDQLARRLWDATFRDAMAGARRTGGAGPALPRLRRTGSGTPGRQGPGWQLRDDL